MEVTGQGTPVRSCWYLSREGTLWLCSCSSQLSDVPGATTQGGQGLLRPQRPLPGPHPALGIRVRGEGTNGWGLGSAGRGHGPLQEGRQPDTPGIKRSELQPGGAAFLRCR